MTSKHAFALQASKLPGRFVDLEPYNEELKEGVRRALDCDPEAWNLFARSGQGEHFESWWQHLTSAVAQGNWIAYAIRLKADGSIVGTTSFLNIKPERQTVEIGSTFLAPQARQGYANPESKLLMLEHAFSSGVRRVELVTDVRNVRSQSAIAKLGAIREGVLRRERVTWTGYIRDSVLFAITDLDWPEVRTRLRKRLEPLE